MLQVISEGYRKNFSELIVVRVKTAFLGNTWNKYVQGLNSVITP